MVPSHSERDLMTFIRLLKQRRRQRLQKGQPKSGFALF